MKWIALMMLTAMSGCALSPAEMRESSTKSAFASTQSPADAARCIVRNAENGNLQARLMPLASNGQEVLLYSTVDGALNATAIAEVSQQPAVPSAYCSSAPGYSPPKS